MWRTSCAAAYPETIQPLRRPYVVDHVTNRLRIVPLLHMVANQLRISRQLNSLRIHDKYLHEMLTHLLNVSGSDLASALPSLNEPTLYALAAAVVLSNPPIPVEVMAGFIGPLRAETSLARLSRHGNGSDRACPSCPTHPDGDHGIRPQDRGGLPDCSGTRWWAFVRFVRNPNSGFFLPTVRWRCFGLPAQRCLARVCGMPFGDLTARQVDPIVTTADLNPTSPDPTAEPPPKPNMSPVAS